MNGSRRFLVHHFLNFTGIYWYASTRDSVTQKFDTSQPEFTFGEFGIQLMISETLDHHTQMLLVVSLIFGVDQYIIDENHDEFIKYMK